MSLSKLEGRQDHESIFVLLAVSSVFWESVKASRSQLTKSQVDGLFRLSNSHVTIVIFGHHYTYVQNIRARAYLTAHTEQSNHFKLPEGVLVLQLPGAFPKPSAEACRPDP